MILAGEPFGVQSSAASVVFLVLTPAICAEQQALACREFREPVLLLQVRRLRVPFASASAFASVFAFAVMVVAVASAFAVVFAAVVAAVVVAVRSVLVVEIVLVAAEPRAEFDEGPGRPRALLWEETRTWRWACQRHPMLHPYRERQRTLRKGAEALSCCCSLNCRC